MTIYYIVVRDARRCRAPHHEGLRPHPEKAPRGRAKCAPEDRLRAVSKDKATEPDHALDPRLQDQIERRFGGATESRQAALASDFAKPRFAGLRAERQANLLIERSGRADCR